MRRNRCLSTILTAAILAAIVAGTVSIRAQQLRGPTPPPPERSVPGPPNGSTLRPDNNANLKLYNQELTAKDHALEGKVALPFSAGKLLAVLNKRSPKHSGD